MDFQTDNNAYGIDYVKELLKDRLPEYARSAYNDDGSLSKIASLAFADADNREYPINNKANTWRSIAYFYTQGKPKLAAERATDIEQQLSLAAALHGIKEDAKEIVQALKTAKAQENKVETKYACVINDVGYLPINSETEVSESARKLADHYGKLNPADAYEAALNIIKRASELNMDHEEWIPSSILRIGQERLFNYEAAKKFAAEREARTGCKAYAHIIDAAYNNYRTSGDDLKKYASEIVRLDRLNGIEEYSAYDAEDPFIALFSGIEKKAAEKFINEHVSILDVFVPISALKEDTFKENVQQYFSKTAAENILNICAIEDRQQLQEALDTKLFDDDKELVFEILAS